MNFPELSLQSCCNSWWEKYEGSALCKGMIVKSFIPYVEQIPYQLKTKRSNHDKHNTAEAELVHLHVNGLINKLDLPVAAMPLNNGEVLSAYRAKRRPCLVLSSPTQAIDRKLIRGKPKRQTSPTFLLAPYYGTQKNNKRAGYNEEFLERIRQCEYPQFLWDKLPIGSSETESVLRLDHLQPMGNHHNSFSSYGYKLTDEALEYVEEQLLWLLNGGTQEDGNIHTYRQLVEEFLG